MRTFTVRSLPRNAGKACGPSRTSAIPASRVRRAERHEHSAARKNACPGSARQGADQRRSPFPPLRGPNFSYTEAYELSRRIAGGLSAAGIRPKQHVAIMMENRPETVWLNFALALIGAVAVPINNAARGDLLAYYVRQSDAAAMIIETAFVERFALVHAAVPTAEARRASSPAKPAGAATDAPFGNAAVDLVERDR